MLKTIVVVDFYAWFDSYVCLLFDALLWGLSGDLLNSRMRSVLWLLVRAISGPG